MVYLTGKGKVAESPAYGLIFYCRDFTNDLCDPKREVLGLKPAHGLRDFSVLGELVYSLPNHGNADLLNKSDVKGKIVLFERGIVPIIDKVLRGQTAGAIGAIIIDNGSCDEKFKTCQSEKRGHVAGSVATGGFGPNDSTGHWAGLVHIPVLLASYDSGNTLKSLLGSVELIQMTDFGAQYVYSLDL